MKPEWQTSAIAIDEFSLHRFHRYEAYIIDLEMNTSSGYKRGRRRTLSMTS